MSNKYSMDAMQAVAMVQKREDDTRAYWEGRAVDFINAVLESIPEAVKQGKDYVQTPALHFPAWVRSFIIAELQGLRFKVTAPINAVYLYITFDRVYSTDPEDAGRPHPFSWTEGRF